MPKKKVLLTKEEILKAYPPMEERFPLGENTDYAVLLCRNKDGKIVYRVPRSGREVPRGGAIF